MKQFGGFPAKTEFTPVPNLFFSVLLPEIKDMAELRISLIMIAALYRKKGYPRFVSYAELLGNKTLVRSLTESGKAPEEVLREGLKVAVKRGTFIHLVMDKGGEAEDIYFMNTAANLQVMAKIQSGELRIGRLTAAGKTCEEAAKPPDIFALYEENIGMLTPMIADELREAEKLYPESWLRDAISEAVKQNKRKWSYISAILERWAVEGKSDGAYQRNSETNPDKYSRQKYGHMVQR